MNHIARTLCIPTMFLLGACACSDDIIVPPPVVPPPVVPQPVTLPASPKPDPRPAPSITAPEVRFDFNSSVLSSTTQDQLKANAVWLSKNSGSKVVIEGYCDERGTEEYNMALGERRASTAREYLVNLGVDPARLSTVSYGKEHPVDPGHNEEAWAKNRRVHFDVK